MAFQLVACPKPAKGEAWLESKKRSRERKAAEDAVMASVRKQDGQCRYPLCAHRTKKPRLECAHMEHRGMGGNPTGDKTQPEKLITLCFIDHGAFDRGELDIIPLSADKGTRGPCSWHVLNKESGKFVHVASEKALGVSEVRR